MPTTPNLSTLPADALAAELARREEEAQRQQAETEAAWGVEQAVRAREVLDGWRATEDDLIAAERTAEEEFRTTVLEDPMIAAYVRVRWHRYRRAALRSEAASAANMLGEPQTAERITALNNWGSRLSEDVAAIVETAASNAAAEESQRVMNHLQTPEG